MDEVQKAVQQQGGLRAATPDEITTLKAMEPPHPYEADDALNDRLYNVSRKVDKILNREPVDNHMALIGFLQISGARRKHEHDQKKLAEQQKFQETQMEAYRNAQRAAQFGVTQ